MLTHLDKDAGREGQPLVDVHGPAGTCTSFGKRLTLPPCADAMCGSRQLTLTDGTDWTFPAAVTAGGFHVGRVLGRGHRASVSPLVDASFPLLRPS